MQKNLIISKKSHSVDCVIQKMKQVYNFGLIPIGNNLQKSRLQSLLCQRYPLSLMLCSTCGHFQLSISVNPKILYAKNYTYLTGVTKTFNKHFSDYSKWIIKKCKIKKFINSRCWIKRWNLFKSL